MNKFFKLTTLTMLAAALWFGLASAQDLRDSIVLESKPTLPPDSGAVGSGILRVKATFSNKDTLANVTVCLVMRTLTNGAYATLGYDPDFPDGPGTRSLTGDSSLVELLPGTQLNTVVCNYSRYHSNSPDSAAWTGTASPPSGARLVPAQLIPALRDLLEIRFDTVVVNPGMQGQFEIDTTLGILSLSTEFIARDGSSKKPVFVKSLVTVGTTDVRDIDKGVIPREYALSQNYPNPFNANTQISFALPKAGNARLDIYNVLGQKVSTLVNEYMTAGSKIVNWDGRDDHGVGVPSGVYFYQLVSQDFRQTKKMLLIK